LALLLQVLQGLLLSALAPWALLQQPPLQLLLVVWVCWAAVLTVWRPWVCLGCCVPAVLLLRLQQQPPEHL